MSKQISMPYDIYVSEIDDAKQKGRDEVWSKIAKFTEIEVFASHSSYDRRDCRIKFQGNVVDLILKLRELAGYPEPPCKPRMPE